MLIKIYNSYIKLDAISFITFDEDELNICVYFSNKTDQHGAHTDYRHYHFLKSDTNLFHQAVARLDKLSTLLEK